MKKQLPKKQITHWLKVAVIGIALGFALQFVRAWTEPTTAPPGGNVGAPINTGPIKQTKEGGDICVRIPAITGTEKCLSTAGGTATPICGNGICESGETAASCPSDCSVSPPPPPPPCECGDLYIGTGVLPGPTSCGYSYPAFCDGVCTCNGSYLCTYPGTWVMTSPPPSWCSF